MRRLLAALVIGAGALSTSAGVTVVSAHVNRGVCPTGMDV